MSQAGSWLPRGQQHLEKRLQQAEHSDAHRLTSTEPEMIFIPYKTVVHPGRRCADGMSATSGTVGSMDVAQPEAPAVPTTEDERDIALCKEIKARGEAGVPHAVFMASLGAA